MLAQELAYLQGETCSALRHLLDLLIVTAFLFHPYLISKKQKLCLKSIIKCSLCKNHFMNERFEKYSPKQIVVITYRQAINFFVAAIFKGPLKMFYSNRVENFSILRSVWAYLMLLGNSNVINTYHRQQFYFFCCRVILSMNTFYELYYLLCIVYILSLFPRFSVATSKMILGYNFQAPLGCLVTSEFFK